MQTLTEVVTFACQSAHKFALSKQGQELGKTSLKLLGVALVAFPTFVGIYETFRPKRVINAHYDIPVSFNPLILFYRGIQELTSSYWTKSIETMPSALACQIPLEKLSFTHLGLLASRQDVLEQLDTTKTLKLLENRSLGRGYLFRHLPLPRIEAVFKEQIFPAANGEALSKALLSLPILGLTAKVFRSLTKLEDQKKLFSWLDKTEINEFIRDEISRPFLESLNVQELGNLLLKNSDQKWHDLSHVKTSINTVVERTKKNDLLASETLNFIRLFTVTLTSPNLNKLFEAFLEEPYFLAKIFFFHLSDEKLTPLFTSLSTDTIDRLFHHMLPIEHVVHVMLKSLSDPAIQKIYQSLTDNDDQAKLRKLLTFPQLTSLVQNDTPLSRGILATFDLSQMLAFIKTDARFQNDNLSSLPKYIKDAVNATIARSDINLIYQNAKNQPAIFRKLLDILDEKNLKKLLSPSEDLPRVFIDHISCFIILDTPKSQAFLKALNFAQIRTLVLWEYGRSRGILYNVPHIKQAFTAALGIAMTSDTTQVYKNSPEHLEGFKRLVNVVDQPNLKTLLSPLLKQPSGFIEIVHSLVLDPSKKNLLLPALPPGYLDRLLQDKVFSKRDRAVYTCHDLFHNLPLPFAYQIFEAVRLPAEKRDLFGWLNDTHACRLIENDAPASQAILSVLTFVQMRRLIDTKFSDILKRPHIQKAINEMVAYLDPADHLQALSCFTNLLDVLTDPNLDLLFQTLIKQPVDFIAKFVNAKLITRLNSRQLHALFPLPFRLDKKIEIIKLIDINHIDTIELLDDCYGYSALFDNFLIAARYSSRDILYHVAQNSKKFSSISPTLIELAFKKYPLDQLTFFYLSESQIAALKFKKLDFAKAQSINNNKSSVRNATTPEDWLETLFSLAGEPTSPLRSLSSQFKLLSPLQVAFLYERVKGKFNEGKFRSLFASQMSDPNFENYKKEFYNEQLDTSIVLSELTRREAFERLGLAMDTSWADIKLTYMALLRKSHHDRVPQEQRMEAEERFKKTQEAYERLKMLFNK